MVWVKVSTLQVKEVARIGGNKAGHYRKYFFHQYWNTSKPQIRACTSSGLEENNLAFSPSTVVTLKIPWSATKSRSSRSWVINVCSSPRNHLSSGTSKPFLGRL